MKHEILPRTRTVKVTFVAEVTIHGVPNYVPNEGTTIQPFFDDQLNWKDKKFHIRTKEVLSYEVVK